MKRGVCYDDDEELNNLCANLQRWMDRFSKSLDQFNIHLNIFLYLFICFHLFILPCVMQDFSWINTLTFFFINVNVLIYVKTQSQPVQLKSIETWFPRHSCKSKPAISFLLLASKLQRIRGPMNTNFEATQSGVASACLKLPLLNTKIVRNKSTTKAQLVTWANSQEDLTCRALTSAQNRWTPFITQYHIHLKKLILK